jgi:gliding motility-associated-like protein
MMKTTTTKILLNLLTIVLSILSFKGSLAQEKPLWAMPGMADVNNPYGVSSKLWTEYTNKTNLLLEQVDEKSFVNYVIFSADGNLADRKYFTTYVKNKITKDKSELIYKVGKGVITSVDQINSFYASLQPKYGVYFNEFKKYRDIIVAEEQQKMSNRSPNPMPFNCGSPCTNPGFESGTGFWDYWGGTACANSAGDLCNLTPGFAASAHDLTAVADGFDATVGGTILPMVPPGGGNNAMMLGDGPVTGGNASRAAISFTVSAANANFTYRYAVVLQDPQTGHTDDERPFFRVKIRDAGGNVVQCGDYEVLAKPPMTGFTETSSGSGIYYRNWTTVFIPLSSYIGQCVTVEFTVADCSQGGHYGYAYIDGDCDPLQIVSSSPAICGGSTITLTAPAGGVSYAWTNTAGGTTGIVGSTTGQTANVNQAGTYQVQITMVSGPACIVTLNITVASNPANPVASFTNTTVCAGTATAFTDTSTPTGSITGWSWDFNNDGTSDSNVQNPSFTFAAAGSYPVTLTITMGPCTATITQNVTVNPTTPPVINPAGPFCINAAAVTLTANVAGGTWSGNGITNAATGAFDPSLATVGNNTITYTITGACGSSDTEVIVVNALPTSAAGADITICTGSTGNIGTPTTAGYTYSWSPTTGLSSSTISNPTVTLTNVTAAPVTTTYTVTTTSNGCTSTDVVDVIVNPLAIANAGPAQTICAGTTATLAGAVGGAATSGTWGGGAGTFTPNNNTLNAVYTPSAAEEAAGSVTLTLVSNDPAGPCPVATSTVTITINPIATIDAGADQTTCIGGSITLAGIIGGGATSGTWSGGTGTFAPNATTANATYTPSAAEEAAGTVTLTFTSDDPAGPCASVNDQMVITITQLPTVGAGLDQTICNGSTATLSGTIGGAATSATWTGGTGTYAPNNTTLNAVYTPSAAELAAGTVTLTLTTNDPNGPCVAVTDQMTITINPVATIDAGVDQTICIGSTVTLAGIPGGSATSGTWSGGTGTFAPNSTAANAVYTPSAAEEAAGTVTLTFTSDDPIGPCPSVTDQMVITINALPTVNAGTTQAVCSGASITLGGSVGGSATSGTWTGGTGTFVPNNTTLNAVYTPSAAEYAAGSVTLTLTTNDPAGPCTAVSATVTHNFFQNPVVNFTVDVPRGCPVHCVQFTDLSVVGGGDNIASWSWNFGDNSPVDVTQNPAHCYSNTGFYDVSLTATSNNGCATTFTIAQMIQVFAMPVAEFTSTPNPASVLDPTVTLINQSSSDVNYWDWTFGDGDTLNNTVTPNPIHTYPNVVSGSYDAILIVHNSDGCWDTISHPIVIGPEFTFYIPNAFTPNGDNVNDTFFGQGIGIVEYDIWIFDRWGNMIFHGDDLNDTWDGKANQGSEVAQQDVYVWKVKLKDVFGKKHSYLGTVTLVK